MRHGGRPKAEFVDGMPRKQVKSRRVPTEATPPPHIDLRIVRKVSLDIDRREKEQWHDFLDDAASRNHNRGEARALGSIAMTYVPAKLMNSMLAERYPRDFHNEKLKRQLFRKVKSGLTGFLRESNHQAMQLKMDELAEKRESQVAKVEQYVGGVSMSAFVDDADYEWSDDHHQDMFEAETADLLRAAQHPYGVFTMKIRGVDLYGRKYGLDLGLNEVAYDERNGFIGHLSSEVKLDVSGLRRDWDPHANFFKAHDHVGPYPITHQPLPSSEIMFSPPEIEQLVVERV